jgi:type IV secretory pathway VirB2 component (pilin)
MKIAKISLIIALFLFLSAGFAEAAGLVPCGGTGQETCRLCHFFKLIDNLLDFLLLRMVPVVAVLMIVVAGAMLFFGGVNSKMLSQAKAIITSVVIGLIIIFTAFLIVGTVLSAIGLAGWTTDIYRNWWQEGFFQIPNCN